MPHTFRQFPSANEIALSYTISSLRWQNPSRSRTRIKISKCPQDNICTTLHLYLVHHLWWWFVFRCWTIYTQYDGFVLANINNEIAVVCKSHQDWYSRRSGRSSKLHVLFANGLKTNVMLCCITLSWLAMFWCAWIATSLSLDLVTFFWYQKHTYVLVAACDVDKNVMMRRG